MTKTQNETDSYLTHEAARLGMTPEALLTASVTAYLQKEYLTRGDAAKELNVSTRTVSNWLTKGLPHAKIGGSVRILRADLKSWIMLHRVTSTMPRPSQRKLPPRGSRRPSAASLLSGV